MSEILTFADNVAKVCTAIGVLLFVWMPYDRKHLPLVMVGVVLASIGAAYLSGYRVIAGIALALALVTAAKYLWKRITSNETTDI